MVASGRGNTRAEQSTTSTGPLQESYNMVLCHSYPDQGITASSSELPLWLAKNQNKAQLRHTGNTSALRPLRLSKLKCCCNITLSFKPPNHPFSDRMGTLPGKRKLRCYVCTDEFPDFENITRSFITSTSWYWLQFRVIISRQALLYHLWVRT